MVEAVELVPEVKTAASPAALLKWARSQGVQEVDVKFTDLRGLWQHFSLPLSGFHEDAFTEGIGFDGSSIRGFQDIQESDLTLIPDPTTAFIDPIPAAKTLNLLCDVYDPVKKEGYSRDPRAVARRAEQYLVESGIADVCYFGPEAEFFIFTSARWGEAMNKSFYEIDSNEGPWNTGQNTTPNLAYRPRAKEGYFPAPPADKLQDVRAEMVKQLMAVGVEVEVHHHEVGAAGQAEIDMRFQSLLRMADSLQTYKYIIKNVAQKLGYTVTFMPKPLFRDNGSGMHCHQSLWKGGTNLFFDKNGYALLSKTALHYIGGILKHAPALLAFCAPTTNSYRRLVPGYEAPVNLVYSARNRSAAVRIPMYSENPKAKRIEFRSPDPTANPYLAFSAIMMAGLDGIDKAIDPGSPADYDLFENTTHKTPVVPGSLGETLDALIKDHEFLLKGGVFTKDLIEKYYQYKKVNEADAVAMRPHPYEFDLYYDA
ncbi:MAG TPA: type I glutamate--ammonia ligase [Aggregatilineales bacterium]|nr:type I glutamate--ammonia ligase [Aggregatilineales bacterium]